MNELENRISSREVAEMMELEHKDLLRKIDKLNDTFNERKVALVKYWSNSQYVDAKGEQRREFLVTKKGCEFLAHKSYGKKGIIFTDRYMDKFSEMEEKLKSQLPSYMIPDSIERAKAWIKEQEEKLELVHTIAVKDQQITEMQPKASYYDLVLNCKDALSITVIAKDYGLSGKKLNDILEQKSIQYKQGNIWLLYQKHADKGYTCTKTHAFLKPDGENGLSVHTYWTQKGRLFIYELLKSNGILPIVERDDING